MMMPYISIVRDKYDEFVITNKNKYSQLIDKMNGNIKSLNDNQTNVVIVSALEVGGKAPKENSGSS